jgi:hypothetical protein
MKIGRRDFVWCAAAVGLTPSLANVAFSFPSELLHATLPSGTLARRPPAEGAGNLAFKIHGWEPDVAAALNSPENTSAGTGLNAPSSQQIWIGVSLSWRANWR